MRLVVGLGNPGRQFDGTRHNIGFAVIDHLARQHGCETFRTWQKAAVCRAHFAGRSVLLVKPLTFMNLSGHSVAAIAQFYQTAAPDIVVVHDELDFAPGVVRFKNGGGHGGHNGLRSISQQMSPEYCRIRVGIGKPGRPSQGAGYVLAKLDAEERGVLQPAIELAAQAAMSFVVDGPARAMQQFNTRA